MKTQHILMAFEELLQTLFKANDGSLITRHLRPRKQGQKGEKVQLPAALPLASVMLVCPKCGKPVRVGFVAEGDKKLRHCRKCKTSFE